MHAALELSQKLFFPLPTGALIMQPFLERKVSLSSKLAQYPSMATIVEHGDIPLQPFTRRHRNQSTCSLDDARTVYGRSQSAIFEKDLGTDFGKDLSNDYYLDITRRHQNQSTYSLDDARTIYGPNQSAIFGKDLGTDFGKDLSSYYYLEKELPPLPEKAPSVSYYPASEAGVEAVDWDGPDDQANPKNWAFSRKWAVTVVVSLFTLLSRVFFLLLTFWTYLIRCRT
jgi:hypothetical protein